MAKVLMRRNTCITKFIHHGEAENTSSSSSLCWPDANFLLYNYRETLAVLGFTFSYGGILMMNPLTSTEIRNMYIVERGCFYCLLVR